VVTTRPDHECGPLRRDPPPPLACRPLAAAATAAHEWLMTLERLTDVLVWSTVFNYAVLLVWFAAFTGAHDEIHRLHARWFRISVETFDALNYGAMAVYKIGVLLLNVAPLAALWTIS
jgi:hypothetical protein